MGTTAYGGSKGRAANGDWPIGTARCRREQRIQGDMPTPEGTLGYCTGAQEAVSTKRRKKFGSSVAYKTRGTILSQR